jgi:hypothetical protein
VQRKLLQVLCDEVTPGAGREMLETVSAILARLCRPETKATLHQLLRSPLSKVQQHAGLALQAMGEIESLPTPPAPVTSAARPVRSNFVHFINRRILRTQRVRSTLLLPIAPVRSLKRELAIRRGSAIVSATNLEGARMNDGDAFLSKSRSRFACRWRSWPFGGRSDDTVENLLRCQHLVKDSSGCGGSKSKTG